MALLGDLEARLLAYAHTRRQTTVRTGELVEFLGWTEEKERSVLSRMCRKGLIARVRRGLYLVPAGLPPGGRWAPSEFVALSTVISDREGRYQICGPSTFYRYGWIEQVPNRIYAYNNRISGDREVGAVALTLIKVADDRLGGTIAVRAPEGLDVVYASKARSLVDAVYDWSRFDSLPRAYAWICRELKDDEGFAAELVRSTAQFANQGTMRRIGTLLEREQVNDRLLARLKKGLRPSSAFIPWIPNREKRGTVNKRWGVVINDE